MTGKVVSIDGKPVELPPQEPAEVNEKLVAMLEELLEEAKKGEVVGFAGAVVTKDLFASYQGSGCITAFGVLGALDMLKAHLIARIDQEER